MKRLVKRMNGDSCGITAKDKETTFVTETVWTKEEAIKAKMCSVEPKIFGIKMIKYQQEGMRKVWVPYYFMIYDFKVKRNVFFNKSQKLSIKQAESESYMMPTKCMRLTMM